MAKSFPSHKIKSHLVYTAWEVADALGCHRQTVIRWIRHKGLAADTSSKPWLIEGHVLKAFLGQRQRKARCKLALHHCYCLSCRGPREPDGKIADYVQETVSSGRLTALCPTCGAVMNKIIRRLDLEAIQAKLEVTLQQVSPRLVSCTEPHSKVTLKEERETHVKTHLG